MIRKFTPEEITKLSQFRERLSDILNNDPEKDDDYYLIRWLRARNLDLDKAEQMLRASLKWRKENNIDGILDEGVPEKFRKIYPTAYFGIDKEHNGVLLVPLGRNHYRIAIEEVGLQKMVRYFIYWMEWVMRRVRQEEQELGIKGIQLVQIADLEYYSVREFWYGPSREFLIETQKLTLAHYPEMLKTLLIINAPFIFEMAYNKLVKPLLPKETLEKMDIFGPEKNSWKAAIRERFPTDRIPIHWGGTLRGSDPYCTQDANVWEDAPIPLTFFTQDIVDEHGFTKTKVGARNKLKLDIHVSKIESEAELRWKFTTEGHDIGFKVTCPNGNTLVPLTRLDSHCCLQQGFIQCTKTGNYQLLFDNTFSYTKSKILKYQVEVIGIELSK